MTTTRRALRHDVRDGVIRAIIEGRIGAGERLIELQIAAEYGTSQAPVREALRELEVLGFVQSQPHRGTYVRDPWQRGMLELFEVRAALEEYATRLATPRLTADTSELRQELEAMAVAAAEGDVAGVVEHSERFHGLIVEASGNALLQTMWRGLSIHDHTEVTTAALRIDLVLVAASHQPIMDAIAVGDVERAARAGREHQEAFERILADRAAHPLS